MPYSILTPIVTAALITGGPGAPRATQAGAGADARSPDPAAVTMQVDIWPEFDDPRVLVIYDGELAPGTTLPREIRFLVPADAQVHMAGGIDANGGHLHAEFQSVARDDGLLEISYALEVPRFYMEFYYDPLGSDDQRRFTYPVVSPFRTDSLWVRVQQPLRATDFRLEPAADRQMTDDRGLDYGILAFADLARETRTPVTVAYRKSDREPSVVSQPPADPAAAADPPTTLPWATARTWVLGLLFVAFLGMGLYQQFGPVGVASGRPANRVGRGGGTQQGPGGRRSGRRARYCTECGSPLRADHRYCGQCGEPTGAGA